VWPRLVIVVGAAAVVIAAAPGAAGAASIAYIDGGDVWLSSLRTATMRPPSDAATASHFSVSPPSVDHRRREAHLLKPVERAREERAFVVVQGLGAERHVHG
jgi:hypothetical protein